MSYDELPEISSKTFVKKSEKTKKLIRQSLQIIIALGVPVDDLTDRQKEKMAMAFLAVGDVHSLGGWKRIKDSNNTYSVTTREIIDFHNTYFEENISKGSYDDIRRKDLARLILATIVVNSKPGSNTSNPTRGYRINSEYSRIIKNYGQPDWFAQVSSFNQMHPTYQDRISTRRDLPKLSVTTPDGKTIELKDGEHNAIQKQIIEEFLPRFGYNAVVLYCGDSDNKYGLIHEKEELERVGFSDLKQSILPDVVAYSSEKNWVFLIEAYHTSNPITPQRKMELQQEMGDKAACAVFVTAFENSTSYRNCPEELAWETEVWIATEPDHLIHRNGHRFMGPYERVRRGSLVKHKSYGLGTVVKVDTDSIVITFPEAFKTGSYPYPSSLDLGIITVIEL